MPDYSKSVIYIIKPNINDYDENDVYYGSTTNFKARCKQHLIDYYNFNNKQQQLKKYYNIQLLYII